MINDIRLRWVYFVLALASCNSLQKKNESTGTCREIAPDLHLCKKILNDSVYRVQTVIKDVIEGYYVDANDSDSIISFGYLINGIHQGYFSSFYPQRSIKEDGYYNYGRKVGPWTRYDENGNLLVSEKYTDIGIQSLLNYRMYYFHNGLLDTSRSVYSMNHKEGDKMIYRIYCPPSSKIESITFFDNQMNFYFQVENPSKEFSMSLERLNNEFAYYRYGLIDKYQNLEYFFSPVEGMSTISTQLKKDSVPQYLETAIKEKYFGE